MRKILQEHIHPLHIFLTGLACIPAYLFQPILVFKFLLVLFYVFLAVLSGKKLKPLYFIIMVSAITFFELLVPWGRVLVEIGPVKITEGALEKGLLKGLTIVGLVFISLFSIRKELQLPGLLGGLIGKLFLYFEQIFVNKKKVDPKHLIRSLDVILFSLFNPETQESPLQQDHGQETQEGGGVTQLPGKTGKIPRTDLRGWILLTAILLLSWLTLGAAYF